MLRAARSRKARAFAAGLSSFSVLALLAARSARADSTLQGQPIQTSNYTLDLFQGPTLASSRVTAMGGAYTALAEGAEGIPSNAAAASQRYPYSTEKVDYEVTGGVTFPGSIRQSDFDNNGKAGVRYGDFFFATLGGFLQYENWGFGSLISMQSFSLHPSQLALAPGSEVQGGTVRLFKADIVASYGFFDGQLHIGGGLRGAVFTAVDSTNFNVTSGEKLILGTYGAGVQGSALWRPNDLPIRLGATIRSPILAAIEAAPFAETDAAGSRRVGSFYLPRGVNLPTEVEWGVAVQIGPRPLNIPWTDEETLSGPEVEAERRTVRRNGQPQLEPPNLAARRILRRRYRALNRQKLLLSYSMLLTGPTHGAVGIESMLTQVVDRSGERTSVTIRGGAEVEAINNRLQVRAGSYVEPTRFRESRPRLHATTGFELRVVEWSLFGIFPEDNSFRVSGAVDVAPGYFGWSVGVGSWY